MSVILIDDIFELPIVENNFDWLVREKIVSLSVPELFWLTWPLAWFVSGDRTMDMESSTSQQTIDLVFENSTNIFIPMSSSQLWAEKLSRCHQLP